MFHYIRRNAGRAKSRVGQNQAKPCEIIAEILELCRKPTAKTQIMYKTNMSYHGVQKFIKRLLKLELLRLSEDDKKYVTTEKGFEFIGKYKELEELLKS